MNFRITTDACSDLTTSYATQHGVVAIPMEYILEGTPNLCSLETISDSHDFYETVRGGKMPTTSMINTQTHIEFFEDFLKNGEDVLHIAFSSNLSGTCQNANLAVEELKSLYPDRKVVVVDSLCASMGEALLVMKAVEKRDTGADILDTADYLNDIKRNVVHLFTVDSLQHLHRGGRVSKVTAVVGSMLSIKPVLHVDDDGRLVSLSKAKGRKKSLKTLVSLMEEKIKGFEDQNTTVLISHGDALEDAQYVRDLVKEKLNINSFEINFIGPIIGAHSGPSTVALFFIGSKR